MKKTLQIFVALFLLLGGMSYAQVTQLSEGGGTNGAPNSQFSPNSPCASVTQFPFFEGFEVAFPAAVAPGNAAAPSCWINLNEGSSTYLWRRATTASYIRTGSGSAQHYSSSSTITNDHLITPVITLTGNERLRFYVKGNSTYIDFIKVGIFSLTQAGHDVTAMSDTALFTTILPNTFAPQHEWTEIIVNLNNYVGDVRIAFIRNTLGGYYLNLDDVTIETIPTCPQPVSSSIMVEETSTTINWVPGNASQNSFYLYYKTSTASNYDSVFVNGTTHTLQNLTAGTTYNYYIKSDCSSELSSPTPVKTFKTLCPAISSLPVTESFDTYGTGTSAFPTCWYKNSTHVDYPYVNSTNFSAPGSMYFYSAYPGAYNIAVSPKIDPTIPINTIKATMKLRASGLDDTLFVGVMSNPYDMSTFEQVGFLTVTTTGAYQDKELYFTNYTGTGRFLALKNTYGASSSTIYVDNIVLDVVSSCPNPTNLYVTNIADVQVDLGFTENGTATSWNVEYGHVGFTQGTGTLVSGLSSNPATITGLTALTNYQIYIQANCGSGNLSSWSLPITFTTACSPISTLPYAELFDSYGSATYPTCWYKLSSNTEYPALSSTSPFSPDKSMYFTNGTAGYVKVAITPLVNPTIAINTLKLNLMLKASGLDDTLYVGAISNINDINSFETIAKLTTTSTSSWEEKEIFLSSYTGNAHYIAIKGSYGATSSTIYVDNFVISNMPTCPKPTALVASNINTTGFDLAWTENGTASTWNIEYGPVGFIQGSGTMISNVTNPYTVTGLTPGTTYQFYVQSNCGSELSLWSSPFQITPECDEVSQLPWTENFDTYSTGTGTFPTCWKKLSTYTTLPYISTTSYEGVGSLYMTNSTGNSMYAVSQKFSSFIPLNTLNLNFKMRASGLDDTLYIGTMSNATDPSTFELLTKYTVAATGTWYDIDYSLENYLGSNQYIAFKVSYGASTSTYYIDNVEVGLIPTCKKPRTVSHSNTTQNSVDLSWIQDGNATVWNIEYGLHGFTPGAGQVITGVTTNPYTLSGLNPNTFYDVYIQADCGSGDVSAKSFKYSFMSGCGIIATVPYIESFDAYGTGSSAFPTCWTKISQNTSNPNISSTNQSAPGALYLYTSTSAGYYSNYAVAPQFASTIPLNSLQMEFDFRSSGTGDTLYIGAMSSPTDTTTFETIAKLDVTTTGVFNPYVVDLSSYTGTGSYIAFKAVCNPNTSTFYIDNLVISAIPTCPKPVNLVAANMSQTTADISWTESGTATSWNIEYGVSGFIPGTGTIVSGVTNTFYQLSGLNPETAYDFYVVADCGQGSLSQPSTPYTFTTACLPITTIPWVENFDTYATGSSNFPTCWKKLSSYAVNNYPYVNSSYSSSPSNSLYLYAGVAASYNYVITPQFDASIPLNTLKINFKMRASATDDTLYIGVMTNPYDASTFELIEKRTVTTASFFEDVEVYLNNYTGAGQYIALKSSYGASSSTIYVDNIVVNTLPNCLQPSNLIATALTSTSADISWVENGTANEWIIEYGVYGFTQGTGTMITNVMDTFYQITNLLPSTSYQVYVKSNCGGMESNWSAPYTFTTLCPEISTLPVIENFDNYSTGTGAYPTCWNKNSYSTSYPNISTTNFSSPGSLYLYAGSTGAYCYSITPKFNSTIPVNTLMAEFKLRNSAGDDTLYVGVMSDPSDTSTFELVSKFVPSATSTWENFEIYFDNYTGTGTYIAFKSVYTTTTTTLYLDNLKISAIPTCAKPSQLSIANPTSTSAYLEWVENGNATTWNIEYGPTGFVLGTGTQVLGVTSNPYLISGLTPQTTYQFYVQADCGGGDLSAWSLVGTFSTLCTPVTTIPYNENFDTYSTGTGTYPTCWSKLSTNTTYPYISTTNSSAPGSMYLYSSAVGGYCYAITPMFDPTISLNTLKAEFKVRNSAADDTVYVGIMTDPTDISTFTLIQKVTPSATSTWQDVEVFFNNYTGTGNFIAFKNEYTTTTNTIYIDNLSVFPIPSCPRPTQLVAGNSTNTSVDLSWTETGSATTWNIEYGPVGFTPGTGTMFMATSNPFSLVGLTHSSCFDFYVQSVCSPTDLSVWSQKGSFCTSQVPVNAPFMIDFESASGLQTANNTTGNNWYIGTDTAHTVNNTTIGQNALYVSNDNGLTNAFTVGSATVVWAYRDVYFTPSTADYTLSFDWKCQGEGTTTAYDYLSVYIGNPVMPVTSTTTTITQPTGSDTIITKLRLQPTWQSFSQTLPLANYSGQTKRIYFMWRNDGSGGTQPPAAVDNFSITSTGLQTCTDPTNLAVSSITSNTATVTWTAGGTETEWELDYKLNAASTWTTVNVLPIPTHILTSLQPSSSYDVRVRAKCNATTFSGYTSTFSFSTLAVPCNQPTGVTASNITDNAATITWTPGGTETSWQVEYKLSTSSNWTAPAAVSTPTIPLQGLQNNSTYDVRVKSLCNPGESAYTTPIQFTTTGGTVTFTIAATATGPGTITPSGNVSVVSGSNQLFTFTPNTGCEVSTLLIDNISVTNPGLSYNFSNVTTNHTIQVTFGTIGINESEIAQLVELYPNPTSSYIDIRVKNDQLGVKETQLFDMYGKLIQVVELQDNSSRLDVSHLSAGIYFIKMETAKGTITKKFVKK